MLTSGDGSEWSSGSQTSLAIVHIETCISCSGRVSIYFSNCVSGITLIPRLSRARDLVTTVEIGSARFTSLERVTTGPGSVSRGARTKPNSLADRDDPPYLPVWFP